MLTHKGDDFFGQKTQMKPFARVFVALIVWREALHTCGVWKGETYPQVYCFVYSSLLYLKFVMLWSTIVLADYMLEFRFEFLWPFWMMLRSVYDSFKYQGLVSTHLWEFQNSLTCFDSYDFIYQPKQANKTCGNIELNSD